MQLLFSNARKYWKSEAGRYCRGLCWESALIFICVLISASLFEGLTWVTEEDLAQALNEVTGSSVWRAVGCSGEPCRKGCWSTRDSSQALGILLQPRGGGLFLSISKGTLETDLVFTKFTLFMCAEPQCNENAVASWQGELKEILRVHEPNPILSCGDLSESYS